MAIHLQDDTTLTVNPGRPALQWLAYIDRINPKSGIIRPRLRTTKCICRNFKLGEVLLSMVTARIVDDDCYEARAGIGQGASSGNVGRGCRIIAAAISNSTLLAGFFVATARASVDR